MKKISLIILTLMVTTFGLAQTSVGSGTLTGNSVPINAFYEYSYSQSIYYSSEILASGSITGIRYYVPSGVEIDDDSYDWVVYIGETTKTNFTGTSDWVATTGQTMVYDDSAFVTPSANGDYVDLVFSTPFSYSGNDNIIITVVEEQPGYGSSSDDFYTSSTVNDRSISYWDDDDPQVPSTPFDANSVYDAIPNITFMGITPACTTVDAVDINSVTPSSFDVIIDNASGALEYAVEYGQSGFTVGNGTTVISTMDSVELTGLTDNTDYDVYVKAICSTVDTSLAFGPVSVTTPCSAIVPTHEEFFDNYLPSCWTEKKGQLNSNSVLTGTSSLWASGSNAAKINIYSTNREEWLISPSFDLSAGNNYLGVQLRATEYNSNTDAVWGVDDTLAILISNDNGVTWDIANALEIFDVNNALTATAEMKWFDLSANTGTVKFAFYGASSVSNEDIDVFADNFYVGPLITCFTPLTISSTYNTNSSVDLAWTVDAGAGNNFQVATVESGQAFSTATLSLETGLSANITGLVGNTDYEFYIREICGAGDTSAWINDFLSVTTDCDPVGIGYTEDFTSYVPACWDEASGDLGTASVLTSGFSNWGSDEYGNNTGPNGDAAEINVYSTGIDEWLISPSIDISTNATQVSFDMIATEYASSATAVWDTDDTVAVVVSTDNGATWDLTNAVKVFNDQNPIAAAGERVTINLTPYTSSGTVKIGFYAQSTSSGADIDVYVDNFEVEAVPDVMPSLVNVQEVYCGSSTITTDFYLVNNSLANAGDVAYEVFVDGTSLLIDNANIPADDSVMISVGPLNPVVGSHIVNVVTTLDGDPDQTNDSQSITVYVSNPTPQAVVTDVNCFGGTDGEVTVSTIDAIGDVDYLWGANANSAITPTITALAQDLYSVTVTDSVGCTAVLDVTVAEPTVLEIMIDSTQDVACFGGMDGGVYVTTTGGTTPYTFDWDNGGQTEDLDAYLGAGAYALTVTDDNGCVLTTPSQNVNEPAELIVTAEDNLNGTATATVSGGVAPYNYEWDNGDLTQTQTTAQLGTQSVIITDDNGCTASASVETVLGLDDNNPLSSVKVYPNPASTEINIDLTSIQSGIEAINLRDNTGKLIQTLNNVNAGVTSIDVSGLADGIYLLELVNNNQINTLKVVVK